MTQNRKQNINTTCIGEIGDRKQIMIVYSLQRDQSVLAYAHFQDLWSGKLFLLMFPREIIDGLLDAIVKDISYPDIHIYLSRQYNC